jgi:uncharacterized protein YjbJ (UPF0337 family)
MKKVFAIAVAALSLTFAACTDGAQNEEANALVEDLKAQLESGDASGVQGTLATAQEKIAELVAKDPEAAKTYVAKVQEFVKENQEKIVALVGDNAVAQGLVTTLVNTPAETVISTLTAGQSVIDNAQQAAEGLQDSLESTVSDAIDQQVDEAQSAVEEKVNQTIDEANQKANEKINEAADKANEKINEAAKKLGF